MSQSRYTYKSVFDTKAEFYDGFDTPGQCTNSIMKRIDEEDTDYYYVYEICSDMEKVDSVGCTISKGASQMLTRIILITSFIQQIFQGVEIHITQHFNLTDAIDELHERFTFGDEPEDEED